MSERDNVYERDRVRGGEEKANEGERETTSEREIECAVMRDR